MQHLQSCFVLIERKIQFRIQIGVICKVVDSWWNNIMDHTFNAGYGFNYACCAKTVTRHTFVELIFKYRVFSEHIKNSFCFSYVSKRVEVPWVLI